MVFLGTVVSLARGIDYTVFNIAAVYFTHFYVSRCGFLRDRPSIATVFQVGTDSVLIDD